MTLMSPLAPLPCPSPQSESREGVSAVTYRNWTKKSGRKWKWKSESGRKWIKGGDRRGHLKKLNINKWKKVKVEESEPGEGVGTVGWRKEIKKVKVGKSKKGASAGGRHGHMKNWKWKREQNQSGRKWKGGKVMMEPTDRDQSMKKWKWKKSVKSESENSVSKWKVKVAMGNVGSRGGAGIATGWKLHNCEDK